jgi:parvulin-like peptidyl-prolyl isomerase
MSKRKDQSGQTQTRKQIALSRREREQVRRVYIGLGIVVALTVIVLAVGLVQTFIIEPNSPVAIVNGEKISTGAYRTRVRYERFLLDNQYLQLLQQQQAASAQAENDQLSEFLANQYQQLANQTLQQRSVVDRQTLDRMIEDKLIADEAAARGITVSEEEVDEFINRILAGRQGGLTAAAANETAEARVEASATAALWTPTPTFTPSPTITATTEVTPTTTPVDTPTPAPTPTFNIIDKSTLSTEYTNWLNTLAESVDLNEATYRQFIRKSILREKLQEAIGNETPKIAEQARARHILVETEEEAQTVIERLKAGEDFGDLARELSLDTASGANGGDLGFVPRGRFVEPIDKAVFSLPIGEISEPIESQFGWHVIEVLEREERELSAIDYRQAQQQAFTDWLEQARSEAEIEDLWTLDSPPEDNFSAR